MQPRTLVWLSFVVAALGAFIYFFERDLPSADERRERAEKVVELESGEIQALTIAHGGEEIRLERAPQAPPLAGGEQPWRMVRPLETRADADAVRDLLGLLTDLRQQRRLEEFDAIDLGLAEPRARLTVETDTDTTVLLLGDELPATGSLALTVEGRREVYAVSTALADRVLRPVEQWYSRAWTELPVFQVRRLEVETPEQRAVFERGEDFRWRRAGERPETDGAENGESEETGVTDLLYAVGEVRGERLLTADEVASLPTSPELLLRLSLAAGGGEGDGDGEREELAAYAWMGGWALTNSSRGSFESGRPGAALKLPAAAVEPLRRSLQQTLEPVAVSLTP
jgi:hypothetical protein